MEAVVHPGGAPPGIAPNRTGSVPILVYHRLGAVDGGREAPYTLGVRHFAAHARHLRDEGYATYTVGELVEALAGGAELAARSVAITFDDAFRDFYAVALPLLVEHGLRATLYAPTGHLGRTQGDAADPLPDARLMTAEMLRETVAQGVECGSHSHTHAQLDLMTRAGLRREVAESKEILEECLELPVTSFAYPYGYYSRRVRNAVDLAGYETGCAVGELAAPAGSDPLALPRLTVAAGTTAADLEVLLHRHSASAAEWRVTRGKELVRRVARRAQFVSAR